ncbi:hypothetical protein P154DRAFT_537791 [Amniculicola lignicola CBS 123094]|uniref:NACHT-NTPase and P-loop NTPases N-terminal domain-containing protein n=1 Tax=Amniculicola lignicola CBS 123094 TaxID=1392246 RepID=A0A6A5W4C4_9PLEO|nr:hypothetical protein P154DRAFT_537791 [Amniculicola lignicola CBS 123094]
MSSVEIFSLIAGIIPIAETCVILFEAVKDIEGLPQAFKEVNDRLPLVQETLALAKPPATTIQRGKEADALKKLLEGCETKTEHLKVIFVKIEAKSEKTKSETFIHDLPIMGIHHSSSDRRSLKTSLPASAKDPVIEDNVSFQYTGLGVKAKLRQR